MPADGIPREAAVDQPELRWVDAAGAVAEPDEHLRAAVDGELVIHHADDQVRRSFSQGPFRSCRRDVEIRYGSDQRDGAGRKLSQHPAGAALPAAVRCPVCARWSMCAVGSSTSAACLDAWMSGWSGVKRDLDLHRHRGGAAGRAGCGFGTSSPPADQHRREARAAGRGTSAASALPGWRLHQLLLGRW